MKPEITPGSKSVLFLCLGNICRSPAAEAVFRTKSAGQGHRADSAGTGGWHIGQPPYGPMQDAARARGYNLGQLRARQLATADFHDFDLIIAMDAANLADAQDLAPAGSRARIARLLDFAATGGKGDVPDPYYTRDFEAALDLIEAGVEGLIRELTTSPKRENQPQ